jgi:hypothetical protein
VSLQWGAFALSTGSAGDVTVFSPDGTVLRGKSGTTANSFDDVVRLPLTGTHAILVEQRTTATGSTTLTKIYNVPADPVVATTIGGSAVTVTTTVPGQNGTISFPGTASQRISLQWGAFGGGNLDITIRNPDGTILRGRAAPPPAPSDVLTLPATGSCTIEPTTATTRSARPR